MTIQVICPNGHRLQAQKAHAGRSLPCPTCGATVMVPEFQGDDAGGIQPAAATSASSSGGAANSGGIKIWLLATGALGGSALGLILVLAAWFALAPKSNRPPTVDPIAEAPAAPQTDDAPDSVQSPPGQPSSSASQPPSDNAPAASAEPEDINAIEAKLRKIGLAFHNHHDTFKRLAPSRWDYEAAAASSGEPPPRRPDESALSWRVHLLPFLGQKPLYDQFHLDEPWDSPHNKTLLEHMPEIYRSGNSEEPATRYQVITGPNMLFGNARAPRFRDIRDGPSHTILALVTGPDRATPWTKPDELTLDPSAPLDALGELPGRRVICAMADGATLVLHDNVEPEKFLALATPNGREIVDAGSLRRQHAKPRAAVSAATAPRSKAPAQPEKAASATTATGDPVAAPTVDVSSVHARLHAIGSAFQLHVDHFRMFTHPASKDEFGTRLSWRVHLLPFLGEQAIYDQFHFTEPWDSPHNQELLKEIPAVYRFDESPNTRVRVFSGPQMLFETPAPTNYQTISDGAENTLLALVVGPSLATPWTKPDGISFEPQNVVEVINSAGGGPIECVTADAKLLTLPSDVPQDTLTALITPRGGDVVDAGTLREQHGPKYEPDRTLTERLLAMTKINHERQRKLKSIALAMLNHHDTFRQFPISKYPKHFNQEGQPHLSWRVHLLQFLDQQPLYERFNLEEPWDSPHNKALIEHMPEIYRDPLDEPGATNTRYVTFSGPDTPFAGQYGPSMRNFRDGTSRTLLVVIAGGNKAIPWTKPQDIAFETEAPIACLGEMDGPGIYCVKVDGAVGLIKSSISPEYFKGLVTPAGGEQIPRGLANFGFR